MKEKTVLFASEKEITRQSVDPETGKVKEIKYNTLDLLRQHGITFLPMPDYVLAEAKGEKKELKLSDLGTYLLAKIDEEGNILNEYGGRNLRRPLPVDVPTILDLANLKNDRKPQKTPEAFK